METERQYDWDDLEVGRFDLNHSEKFFTRKHFKHERFNENGFDVLPTMDENRMELGKKTIKSDENKPTSNTKLISPAVSARKPCGSAERKGVTDLKSAPSNILRQPLTSKNQIQCPSGATQAVPSVVKYKDIYEKKRQEVLQKKLEEEKKMRIFKSKPAPNFSHEPKPRKQVEMFKYTTPVTPLVLKHSKEMEEKRRRQLEEYKKANEPPKFSSRNPHVLYEEPFIPQKVEHHVEPQPFNLQMERRLEERKQYDKQIKQKFEEKKRQVVEEEYDRKKNEERLIRELRKMTTFKARPNPFK